METWPLLFSLRRIARFTGAIMEPSKIGNKGKDGCICGLDLH